jgi:hypothetical protein
MTINILTDLIPIPCTDRATIDKLRSLLVEIQATWFDNLFDSGLTFSTPEIFEKMQEAICLLERRDNPSAKGIDLKAIASDYALLERIFIAAEWSTEEYSQLSFDSSTMKGCDLVALHRFSAVGILKEVDAYRNLKASVDSADQEIWEIAERLQKKLLHVRQALQDSDIMKAKELVGLWVDDRSIETRIVDSYPDDAQPVDHKYTDDEDYGFS